jgi:hypothetical protein
VGMSGVAICSVCLEILWKIACGSYIQILPCILICLSIEALPTLESYVSISLLRLHSEGSTWSLFMDADLKQLSEAHVCSCVRERERESFLGGSKSRAYIMCIADSSTWILYLEAVCRAISLYQVISWRIPICNLFFSSLTWMLYVIHVSCNCTGSTYMEYLSLSRNYEINFESRTVAIFLTITLRP